MTDGFGGTLRTWRERTDPTDVGLPVRPRRRTPGLTRQELALLAGISVEYVVKLEQGTAARPSAPIIDALAAALRLSPAERSHLGRLAGVAMPEHGTARRAADSSSARRTLAAIKAQPAALYDSAWTLVAWNDLWAALFGEPAAEGRDRNLLWRVFSASGRSGPVVRAPREQDAFEAELVGDLRSAVARYPCDGDLAGLAGDLYRASAGFRRLWDRHVVQARSGERKTVRHAVLGTLILTCDVVCPSGADCRVVIYSAPSAVTTALALLASSADGSDAAMPGDPANPLASQDA